ncbi:MAG: ShlB/FhaC/HecB family hemolysin secretion/activation protein [Nostocaceae cyanobacterium]|nr:ShlB/FhaC/HecB family hemolysin secretion/activation protein [Nostocaceae cyanobacterium]
MDDNSIQLKLGYVFLPIIFISIFTPSNLKAQTNSPKPSESGISPQDILPPSPQPAPIPDTPPSPLPSPEDVLPSPFQVLPEEIPGTDTINVTEFEFTGNTLFTSAELTKHISQKFIKNTLPQTFSLQELLKIATEVAAFYSQRGYSTSGAIISIPETTRQQQAGVVKIKVIEGKLENIIITGFQRLKRNYVRSRLGVDLDQPLNVNRLQEKLQLLSLDPLIENISARLSAGSRVDLSVLEVEFKEAFSFSTNVTLDNSRSPSVGSFQRQLVVREGNVLGLGDTVNIRYRNTDGSNGLDISYSLPVNSQNGSLNFRFNTTDNNVIEPPFNELDIESESKSYEITFRQPTMRKIRGRSFQEFALGVTASLRDSKSLVFNEPFPLSPGANSDGKTRLFALRFFQDWTKQNVREVIAFRSQFSIGLDAFDATINEPIPETGEFVPDSRFFAWQGQAQWVRILAPNSVLLLRANAQIADKGLLSSEQFAIGGLGSVRGYRQNQLLSDNGFFASAEVQLPILRTGNSNLPNRGGVLQIIPFFDVGTAWNNSGIANPNPSTLVSLGMGLQWRHNNNFIARLDWGIPLVSANSRDRTWQENGLLFSLQWNPF